MFRSTDLAADHRRLALHCHGHRPIAAVYFPRGDDRRNHRHSDPRAAHLRLCRSGRDQAEDHGQQQRIGLLKTIDAVGADGSHAAAACIDFDRKNRSLSAEETQESEKEKRNFGNAMVEQERQRLVSR